MKKNKALTLFLLITLGCVSTKSISNDFFRIKKASYQSWQKGTNEKGTNLLVEIGSFKDSITFDSIVFRNRRVPVFVQRQGKSVLLKATVHIEGVKLMVATDYDSRNDLLVYCINNKKHYTAIVSWQRMKMVYY